MCLYLSFIFIFGLCEHLALFSLIHFQVFILQQMGKESLPYLWVCYVFQQPRTNRDHLCFSFNAI